MANDKLWSGRFSEKTDKLVEKFNASISFDQRLALFDIAGSLAHVKMLAKQNILTSEERIQIEGGLYDVEEEIKAGKFIFKLEDEDVHMAIEKRLTELIGDVGGKLHTARSRNDQVATDFRLFTLEKISAVKKALVGLMDSILDKAKSNSRAIMPGYTHLQTAQPVLFAHWLMAYFQMLKRDFDRFTDAQRRTNYSPLGACALAGTSFNIDRQFTAKELGFNAPIANSIDAVSDRDFALDFLYASSVCMMHMSRLAEEIIIFSTSEFNFLKLSDGFCTGSSIMPQKRNPDVPELIRGKTGRVYASLFGLLTTMKGLPLAYNKDMQEDKEGLFDTVDTLLDCIVIFTTMLDKVTINESAMLKAASKGYSTATDLADYLVRKGLAFRDAHHAVGRAVAYAEKENKMLDELLLDELKAFSELIEDDIYNYITVEASVASRTSYGGTSNKSLDVQFIEATKFISEVKFK